MRKQSSILGIDNFLCTLPDCYFTYLYALSLMKRWIDKISVCNNNIGTNVGDGDSGEFEFEFDEVETQKELKSYGFCKV